jgi:charged multivesicular body protein 6
MLGGRITNQDEEEVEDELAALEAEVNGPLPNVPTKEPPTPSRNQEEPALEPVRQPEREAMLA